jgi:hypothetical protein
VPDLPRPPSTLRLTRPYGTEDDFIAHDAPYFGRASVTLANAAARPFGELIRFEIMLTSGATVLRGEGTVVAHHPPGGPRPAGLEVRFARIDARSKGVLDRVRAFRAAGPRGLMSLAPAALIPSLAPPSAASMVPASSPSLAPLPSWSATPGPAAPLERASERSGVHATREVRPIVAPKNREEILERMRERAQRLQNQGALLFYKRETG